MTALDVIRIRRPHGDAARQRDGAAGDVRVRRAGDAVGERPKWREPVRTGGTVGDRRRIEPAHRPRPRQRVEGPAEAGAEHGVLVDAIGEAEPWGDQALVHLDAEVLRVAAEAAQPDLERVVVELLETTIRARHQREVLVAQAEVHGQLLVHLPPVRQVEAQLVLAAGHLFELHALAEAARQPEQEGRVAVPAADTGRGVPGRASDPASEIERSARIRHLRLPVVERQPDEIEARSDFVTTADLGEVDRRGIADFLPPHRRPPGVVPEVGQRVEVENRHPAVSLEIGRPGTRDAGAVQTRNAERFEAEIRAVVGARRLVGHFVRAAVGVEQERRAQRPGLADASRGTRSFPRRRLPRWAGRTGPCTSAFITENLPQNWCAELRFQLILPS